MTYACEYRGQFYSGGAVLYRYIIDPRGQKHSGTLLPPAALYRYNIAPPPPPRQESGEAVVYRYTG